MRKITLIFLFFYLLINTISVWAHSFMVVSSTTNLNIVWNKIESETLVSIPYDMMEYENQKILMDIGTLKYLNKTFNVTNKGKLCELQKFSTYPDTKNIEKIHIKWDFICNENIENVDELVIRSQMFQDIATSWWTHFIYLNNNDLKTDIVLTLEENIYPNTEKSKNLIKKLWIQNEENSEHFSSTSNSSVIEKNTIINNNIRKVIKNFIIIWIEHILIWTDHILFVVVLVMLVVWIKDILKLTVTFTIAHSITLILASLWLISLTWKIVEPIIAASIVYMAIDNFLILRWKKEKKFNLNKRLFITFLFWLFHWLGFAWVLSEISIPEDYFFTALLSFNIWVEIWQVFIVFVLLLPILYLIRKSSKENLIMQTFSILIALIAVYWFIERVFL